MDKDCSCEVCRCRPPVMDAMLERVEEARLLGARVFLLVIRAEDLRLLEAWYGGPVTAFQDIPIKALDGKESMVTPVLLVALEEYREEYAAAIAEAGLAGQVPVEGLELGDCWGFAETVGDVPRSD